jgi:hypothetical protein
LIRVAIKITLERHKSIKMIRGKCRSFILLKAELLKEVGK